MCLVFKRNIFKICLSAFIGASLVKFIKDAESTNELLLAFDFSFFLGYYIGNGIVSYFLYHKTNNKISLEIELIIKDYNDATEKTMKPFLIAIKGYEDRTRNQAMLSAIKAERDDIHFQGDLLKTHIKSVFEKYLMPNAIFFRKSKSKKRTADDCKSLKH